MSNHKILLVDDEQDILDLIGYNLEKEGFEVHMANNGREAIMHRMRQPRGRSMYNVQPAKPLSRHRLWCE